MNKTMKMKTLALASVILTAVLLPAALAAIAPTQEVAKVNGVPILAKDVLAVLSGLNESQRNSYLKDPVSRRQVLTGVIDQQVLALEAEKNKLDQDQAFRDALARARRQLLVEQILSKNLAPKLTEAAAKKYYETNKYRFNTDEVHVQHILCATEAEANEMIKRAKAPGADFQALAEKNSKDPSAKNNRGDIGVVGHDSPFVDEFKNAVFRGATGDIVGPVHTDYGYHVIKIVDKKFGRGLTYDEVELRVKELLKQQMIEEFVGKIKGQAKITVDEKALEKLI